MATYKRGRLSSEEKEMLDKFSSSNLSVEEISKFMNRKQDMVQKYIQEKVKPETSKIYELDQTPNAPPPKVPFGAAKTQFENTTGGQPKRGVAIMTEGVSTLGDDFNKENEFPKDETLLPMSRRFKDCITRAQQ